MYLFFRQMPIAISQKRTWIILLTTYHKGALGSYICNKTLGGQEGGAALHFQGKATNREKFDFTFMFIWEKNSTHSFVLN